MMDQHFRIVSAIVILLALIFFTILLRRLGIIEEQHGKLFSKLITQITLPALILFSMARAELLFSEVELALIMFLASLFSSHWAGSSGGRSDWNARKWALSFWSPGLAARRCWVSPWSAKSSRMTIRPWPRPSFSLH